MGHRKYIILRVTGEGRGRSAVPRIVPTRGAAAAAPAPVGTPSVERATLSDAERENVRRDPEVRAIAADMPFRLIQPVDVAPGPDQDARGPTWGVRAVRADTSSLDGQGIKVAVLDTGIEEHHPAFAGMHLTRKNFTTGSELDTSGHGTHCAATIFGRDVAGRRIGVAPGITDAMIGKVVGPEGSTSAAIVDAIAWAAAHGAHVIFMALAIDFPGFVRALTSEHGIPLAAATSIALEHYRENVSLFTSLAELTDTSFGAERRSILIAASGNDGARPTYEVPVGPPAAARGVISVGALQPHAAASWRVTPFSNDRVEIAGPGVDVVSATLGGGLRSMSGTSMAASHVAGCTALWAQKTLQDGDRIEPNLLRADVLDNGDHRALSGGFEPDDVGRGMVQAPRK